MNLRDYIKGLQDIAEKYPSLLDTPVAYAIDSEGNDYHPVHSEPTLCEVVDNTMYNLELINYFNGDEDDQDNVKIEDVNCIIIN